MWWKTVWTVVVLFSWVVKCDQENVCRTQTCRERATFIRKSLDKTVDPCDNFYQFTCGTFLNKTNRNGRHRVISVFSELESNLHNKLEVILRNKNLAKESDYEVVKMIKHYYSLCMDYETIDKDGNGPLLKLLASIDGLSLLNESLWNTNFTFEDRVSKLSEAGIDTDFLINIEITPNLKNTSELIINLSSNSGDEDFEIKYFAKEAVSTKEVEDEEEEIPSIVVQYIYLINLTITELNGSLSDESLENMIDFETQITNITMQMSALKNNMSKLVNVMTVKELQKEYPYLNWTKYISGKLLNIVPITDETRINVMEKEYFKELGSILNSFEDRFISNFQIWKVIQNYMGNFNKPFRAIDFHLKKITEDISVPEERKKFCMKNLIEDFGIGLSSLYIRNAFPISIRNKSLELCSKIRNEVKEMLETSEWLDEVTRKKSLEKLEKMEHQVAFADILLNPDSILEYYANLTIEGLKFNEAVLKVKKFDKGTTLQMFLDPPERPNLSELTEVTIINAYYAPMSNSIEVPAGILQNRMISEDGPDYLNYAGLGFVFGHELIHAFDNYGRQFDEAGNIREWSTPQMNEIYGSKIECIVDQYNGFVEPETLLNINGNTTISENIADMVGVALAYKGYKKAVKDLKNIPLLPRLNYTADQLFWISLSTTWCSAYRKAYIQHIVHYDSHSPAEFRINGAFQNVPEFAKDFQCPIGSKMNPKKKCRIW